MSLLKNIDVWKGYRPRVCNFDLDDYCLSGIIGNNITGIADIPSSSSLGQDPDSLWTTARATRDAYLRAVNEVFGTCINFYIDPDANNPSPYRECITESQWNAIMDLYNGPDGFVSKSINLITKGDLFFNSLMPSRLKRTDTVTWYYRKFIISYQDLPVQEPQVFFTIDFKTSLYPTAQSYIEYTECVRDYVQFVKRFIKAITNCDFQIYQP